jgi:HSP20 family protein
MAEVKDAPKPKANGATAQQAAETGGGAMPAPRAARPGSPFEMMRHFAEEIDRAFDDFGLGFGRRLPSALTRGHELVRREAGLIPAEWSPRVDVFERDGHFLVRADLPGLTKDDIHVEVAGDMITIRGERKQEKSERREGYSYSECAYGNFYRALPLPEGVDASKATAEFRNGVLEVAMPAPGRPQAQTRRLEVKEKK